MRSFCLTFIREYGLFITGVTIALLAIDGFARTDRFWPFFGATAIGWVIAFIGEWGVRRKPYQLLILAVICLGVILFAFFRLTSN